MTRVRGASPLEVQVPERRSEMCVKGTRGPRDATCLVRRVQPVLRHERRRDRARGVRALEADEQRHGRALDLDRQHLAVFWKRDGVKTRALKKHPYAPPKMCAKTCHFVAGGGVQRVCRAMAIARRRVRRVLRAPATAPCRRIAERALRGE